jgi:hypothetical protein
MTFLETIPPSGLPFGHEIRSAELDWYDMDEPEQWRKQKGRVPYGAGDIRYRFNSHGYRGSEFERNGDFHILSLGCSHVFGLGLPEGASFHERLTERLRRELPGSVVNWNMGVVRASNDFISRTLSLALTTIDPDLVLINFTYLRRREYFTVADNRFDHCPSAEAQTEAARSIIGRFNDLGSPYDDQVNFFRNYKAVETLLCGRDWFYSLTSSPKDLGAAATHLDLERLVGTLPDVDRARDGVHRGPQSHELLYRSYWSKLEETGSLFWIRAARHGPGPNSNGTHAGTHGLAGSAGGCLDWSGTESPIPGWAWDPARPNTPVWVSVYDGDHLVGSVLAEAHREDLARAGMGNGNHAFEVPYSPRLRDRNAALRFVVAGTDYQLPNSIRA